MVNEFLFDFSDLKILTPHPKNCVLFFYINDFNIIKIVYVCMCIFVSECVFGVICLSHLVHFVQYSIVAKCSMHSYCQMVVAPVLDVTNFDCSKLGFEVLRMVHQMDVVHQDSI